MEELKKIPFKKVLTHIFGLYRPFDREFHWKSQGGIFFHWNPLHGACGTCTRGLTCRKSSVNVISCSQCVRSQGKKIWNQTLGNFWENWIFVFFMEKYAIFGLNYKVCSPETNIKIFYLTDLIISVDGQEQVVVFRHKNFAIWTFLAWVMAILVKIMLISSYFSSKWP